MVAIVAEPFDDPVADSRPGLLGRRRPIRWWRGIVALVCLLYFVVPFGVAARFALEDNLGHFSLSAFTGLPSQQGFTAALALTAHLAVVTMVITMGLMVPTAIYVHLRLPKLRRIFDGITLMPIVIPPIVLVLGVLQVAPGWLKGTPYLLSLVYVILTMPFAYRSLDAGLRAIDLKTLVEASRSLGGGWLSTMFRVILPNLRSALLSATVLSLALVLGEFTIASLDQYQTLPVWVAGFQQNDAHISTAVSLLALIVTWGVLLAIVSLDRRRTRRKGRRDPALSAAPALAVATDE